MAVNLTPSWRPLAYIIYFLEDRSTDLGDIEIVHLCTPLREDQLPHVAEQLLDALRQDGLAAAGTADPSSALAVPRTATGPVVLFIDSKKSGYSQGYSLIQLMRLFNVSKPEEPEEDVLADDAVGHEDESEDGVEQPQMRVVFVRPLEVLLFVLVLLCREIQRC